MGKDLERVGANGLVGTLCPAAPDVDDIAAIAANGQRVGVVGEVEDFPHIQGQRVVPAAGEVDRLDPQQLVVAQRRQVQ